MKLAGLLLFVTILFSPGCNEKKVVDDKVMVETYVHVMMNKEIYKNHKDSLKIKINDAYSEAGITEDDFIYTLESFKDDKEKWDNFYNESIVYLDSLKRQDETKLPSSLPKQF